MSFLPKIKGIIGSTFHLGGPSGPILKANLSPLTIAARNQQDNAYICLKAATPENNEDLATKEYVDGSSPNKITVANEAANTTCFPIFVTSATGDLEPKSNAGLTFNSATGLFGATSFAGAGTSLTGTAANLSIGGNAATATTATNATNIAIANDTTTNATRYPTWVESTSGNQTAKTSSTKLTFNPSTGLLSATRLSSVVATGTSPLSVASTTAVTNLNADLLDGKHASHFETYVQSRLQALITNGSALFGDNTNFSGLVYNGAERFAGGGSFVWTGVYAGKLNDELIPVDISRTYAFSYYIKLLAQTNPDDTIRHYGMTYSIDADGLVIGPSHVMKVAGSKYTSLAVDLNPGDWTITLTDATGWHNGAAGHARSIVFYPYTNAQGYTFPAYTYSRNAVFNNAWAAGGITDNVITLNAAYAGPAYAAGTQVANAQSGGTYDYIAGAYSLTPTNWAKFEGYQGSSNLYTLPVEGDTAASNNHYMSPGGFRWGTAFIRIGWLLGHGNYAGHTSTTALSCIAFELRELSVGVTGNVGIGITIPDSFLHLSNTEACVRIDSIAGVTVAKDVLIASSINNYRNNVAKIQVQRDGSLGQGWNFAVSNSSGTISEAARIAPNGTVGIGIAIPTCALDVVGTVKASTGFTGNLTGNVTGNADTATTANNLKSNATTGVMQVVGPATGTTRVATIPNANFTVARTDAAQTFTGTQAFSSTISGSINGNATTATTATNATNVATTDDTTTNATRYPTWVEDTSGNQATKTSSTKLIFNPSTGLLSATRLSSVVTTGTSPLFVASTTVCTNLNADYLDGYHATSFSLTTHTHETLTAGTGITGDNYNGGTARTWSVAYGTTSATACRGDDGRLSDARTPIAHGLVSASHTASDLTTGHFLKATSATTFGFAAHGLTKTDVGLNNVENTALSTWAGSSNITTVGTLSGGDVRARDSIGLVSSKVSGDIFYWTTALQRLAKGTDGQVLKLAGGVPSWAADNNTTYSAGGGISLTTTTFSVAGGEGLTQEASGLKATWETSTANIKMNGAVAVGTGVNIARADHIHPTDTSRAASGHTHIVSNITDITTASTGITKVGTINTGVWQGSAISTTYTAAKCTATWPNTYSANQNLGTMDSPTFLTLTTSSPWASSPTGNLRFIKSGTVVAGGGAYVQFDTSNVSSARDNYNARIEGLRSSEHDGSAELLFFTTHAATTTTAQERLRITSCGSVGIGTIDPDTRLHVEPAAGEAALTLGRQGGQPTIVGTSGWLILEGVDSGQIGLNYWNDGNVIIGLGGGQIGIGVNPPTQKLDVNGNARFRSIASGAYSGPLNRTSDGTLTTATSDIRFKKNVETINCALEKVLKLRGVAFDWRDGSNSETKCFGMIAQEALDIVPELIFKNPVDGFYGMRYAEATAILIEAMKEQQVMIDNQNKRIEKLEGSLKPSR